MILHLDDVVFPKGQTRCLWLVCCFGVSLAIMSLTSFWVLLVSVAHVGFSSVRRCSGASLATI